MKIRLWKNFSKKNNSTKLPPTTSGSYKEIDAVLKTDTSLMNPVFLISSTNADYTTNYVAFENRYYFVSDIVRGIQDVLELHCTLDVLATYKGDITGSSQFVMFDTTGNTEIVDSRLSTVKSETVQTSEGSLAWIDPYGSYILSHVSDDNTGFTRINGSDIDDLMHGVTQWAQDQTGNDMITVFKNFLSSGNIGANIRGITWIPWSIQTIGNSYTVQLGAYTTQVSGYKISPMIRTITITLSIPWQFTDWRRCNPYTQLYLYMPFVGMVSISPDAITSESSISILVSLNQYTGDVAYQVNAGNQVIGTYGASTGISLPIGGSGTTPLQAVTGITAGIGALGAMAVSGGTAGAVLGATGTLAGMLSGASPHSQTAGGLGGGAGSGLNTHFILYSVCHNTNAAPSSVSPIMGTPTMAYKSLSGLSGYVQCNDASIDIAGCDQEKVQVETFLNSGIFID